MTYYSARRDKRSGVPLPALAFYRRNRGLSQATLAARAGLSASTVLHIEKHDGRARLSTIEALAHALRVERAALTLPPPDAHPARVYLPHMPPISARPSLDRVELRRVEPVDPERPANIVSFVQRAEAARVRRDARLELERRTRSHREPWA